MYRKIRFFLIPLVLFFVFYLFLLFLPFPELDTFRERSYGTLITDRNGNVLRVLPADDGVRREWTPLSEMPPGAVKIFVRAEDRRFHFHPGVDPISIAGSIHRNLRAGRIVSGASTISMQLARMVRPHSGGMSGKIQETWDALRLEARLSKNEILELWLNNIPFGSNIEGLPAMSRARFGRSVRELDENRAALLAAVPRRPSLYDPAINPDAAISAALVLSERGGRRAARSLKLNEEELWKAAEEATQPAFGPTDPRTPFFAPHFTERIARIVSAANTGSRGDRKTSFHSTLDLNLQRYAEEQLAMELSFLVRNRVSNGAILAIDNETGAVLVYVGSGCWFDEESSGKIDGVRFRAQPGSCLKPFLYAQALDMGFSPADIMPDIPTVFGCREAYIPTNFNNRFNGPVRLRVALASSLNIPAVYILGHIGVTAFEDYLIDLGFDSIIERSGSYGLGLALGNAEVSLEEMVRAFSVFPRGGSTINLKWEVNEEASPGRQLMSHYAAWAVADILSEKPSRFLGFGFAPVMATPFTSMFKTGTANQYQHIWATAATQRFTVGVWMGNFSGETVIGSTGSAIPARIAARLLAAMEQSAGAPSAGMELAGPLPSGISEQRICTLSGMAAGAHCTGFTREWFRREQIPPVCTWHNVSGVFYPPIFQTWHSERSRAGIVANIPERGTQPNGQIRIPVSGSVFFMNPSIPPEAQALRIETSGFGADALVYSNGILMGSLNQAGVYIMPLSRGHHTVFVEDSAGAFASVNFVVR